MKADNGIAFNRHIDKNKATRTSTQATTQINAFTQKHRRVSIYNAQTFIIVVILLTFSQIIIHIVTKVSFF